MPKTPVPKLRHKTAYLLTKFADAASEVGSIFATATNDQQVRRASAKYTRTRNALIRHLATIESALIQLANLGDLGPLSSMDEPSAVGVARTALGLSTIDQILEEREKARATA